MMKKVFLGLILFIGMINTTGVFANLPQTSTIKNNVNMLYNIDWKVEFNTDGVKTELGFLNQLEIITSVNNLTDIAVISLPESVMNLPLNFENKVKRGTEVVISLGYNQDLKTEFTGYVKDIVTYDSHIEIKCEDALFLFRKSIDSIEIKPASIKSVCQYIVDSIDDKYKIDCDYDITYEKFTIHNATGYDVLKKLQQETKANIYFDTENKILHVHPPYIKKSGEVYYSMQKNIETSSLEFKNKIDDKIEVLIESTGKDGKVKKYKTGTTGGDTFNLKVGPMTDDSIKQLANAVLLKSSKSRLEGTFDTWLIPFVQPTYSARIKDEDYPDKTDWYYVVAVHTKVSSSGGVRTITPGINLS